MYHGYLDSLGSLFPKGPSAKIQGIYRTITIPYMETLNTLYFDILDP